MSQVLVLRRVALTVVQSTLNGVDGIPEGKTNSFILADAKSATERGVVGSVSMTVGI